MQIIGIAGLAGAGKHKIAGLLAAEISDLGYSVKIDCFGLPIKTGVRQEEGGIDKARDRRVMQYIGAAMRDRDRMHYVKALARRNNMAGESYAEREEVADFLIIPDVRFSEEADFCREHGVLVLAEGSHQPLEGMEAAHSSEAFARTFSRRDADAHIPKQPNLTRLAAHVHNIVATELHIRKGETV